MVNGYLFGGGLEVVVDVEVEVVFVGGVVEEVDDVFFWVDFCGVLVWLMF